MSIGRLLPALVAAAMAAACGGKPPAATAPDADATGAPAAAARPAVAAAPNPELAQRIASADVAKGKIQFFQCRACHSLVDETGTGKIGPTLYGVIGRPAGSVPGYAYSEALAQSGIVWTADQIDRWLQRPSDFLPGNRMVFVGIQDPQDRANVIAYIEQQTAQQAAR